MRVYNLARTRPEYRLRYLRALPDVTIKLQSGSTSPPLALSPLPPRHTMPRQCASLTRVVRCRPDA